MSKVNYNRLMKSYFNTNPNKVNGKGNFSYFYWYNYLSRLLVSEFFFEDFYDGWDLDYFRTALFQGGYIGITEHYKAGNVALECSPSGYNVYGKPTKANFSNPVLGSFVRRIHENCEIVYFDYYNSFYDSMYNVISRYAVMLAELDSSFNITLMNSKMSVVFMATTKAEVKTAKAMYDEVSQGNPAVFRLKTGADNVSSDVVFNNVKNSYIGNDLMVTYQTIINNFCTHVGLKNANTQKRERLIKDEVESNDEMTRSLVNMWVDNINECFNRVRLLYPYIKTKVVLRQDSMLGGVVKNEL